MQTLAGETGDALFGVYDGHGEEGHHCATFCKKKLPQQLAKYVRQKRVQKYTAILDAAEGGGKKKGAWNPKMWPLLSAEDFEQCCHRAFLETNKAIRDEVAVRTGDADRHYASISKSDASNKIHLCNSVPRSTTS